jgi:two-component system, chemotaxis family, chemotaxis protein CheY
MRTLIVEDDFASRKLLQKYLTPFGTNDVAINGKEAVEAFVLAHDEKVPYDLICLDIMMPEMDGQQVLKTIRQLENEKGISHRNEVKIIMTTALDAPKDVVEAYYLGGCTSYMVKPIDKSKLVTELKSFGLIAH